MIDFLVDDTQQPRIGLLGDTYRNIMGKGRIAGSHKIRIFSLPDIILRHHGLHIGHICPGIAYSLQAFIHRSVIAARRIAGIHGFHMLMRKEIIRLAGYPWHIRQLSDPPRNCRITHIDIRRRDIHAMRIRPAVITVYIQKDIRCPFAHADKSFLVRSSCHEFDRNAQIIGQSTGKGRQDSLEFTILEINIWFLTRNHHDTEHLLLLQIFFFLRR